MLMLLLLLLLLLETLPWSTAYIPLMVAEPLSTSDVMGSSCSWRSAALSRAWWTYALGPIMGAIAGGYLYDYTLGAKSIRDVIGDGAASSSGGSGGGSSTSTSTSTASTTSMKTEV